MKTKYVLGFLFDELDIHKLLLIRKKRPEWQAGKCNGVGGHIEPYETPDEAMRRECREETSLDVSSWQEFGSLSGEKFKIHLFVGQAKLENSTQTTDEEVEIFGVFRSLRELCNQQIILPNLVWLVPLAWNYLFKQGGCLYLEMKEKSID